MKRALHAELTSDSGTGTKPSVECLFQMWTQFPPQGRVRGATRHHSHTEEKAQRPALGDAEEQKRCVETLEAQSRLPRRYPTMDFERLLQLLLLTPEVQELLEQDRRKDPLLMIPHLLRPLAAMAAGLTLLGSVAPGLMDLECWQTARPFTPQTLERHAADAGVLPLQPHSALPRASDWAHYSTADREWGVAEFDRFVAWEVFEPATDEAILLTPLTVVVKGEGWDYREGRAVRCGSKRRLVADARGLNRYSQSSSFQLWDLDDWMQAVAHGATMIAADIAKGFLCVPLHPDSRRLLGVRHPTTRALYTYTRLPFGITAAPFIFSTLSSSMAFVFWRLASKTLALHTMFVWIDDFAVAAASPDDAARALLLLRALCAYCGLPTWKEKTIEPTTTMVVIGRTFDSVAGTVTVTPKHARTTVRALHVVAQYVRACTPPPRNLLDSVTGSCSWVAQVQRWHRPRIRGFGVAAHAGSPLHTQPRAMCDAGYWCEQTQASLTQSVPLHWPSPSTTIYIDANGGDKGGFGAMIHSSTGTRTTIHGALPHFRAPSSTLAELYALAAALVHLGGRGGVHIAVVTDSAAAAFALLRGSMEGVEGCLLLEDIATQTWKQRGSIRPRWVCREDNAHADWLADKDERMVEWTAALGGETARPQLVSPETLAHLLRLPTPPSPDQFPLPTI
jgi:ribonuclease HI